MEDHITLTSYPKIVISVTAGFRKVVAQQMEWVCIRLGGQWEERVVVSLDKVLITAKFPNHHT